MNSTLRGTIGHNNPPPTMAERFAALNDYTEKPTPRALQRMLGSPEHMELYDYLEPEKLPLYKSVRFKRVGVPAIIETDVFAS